mgnify:CR=1 FL=1
MSKAVVQPFEEYQKSRIVFVQTIAELARRKQNIESLKKLDVVKLLGPLLSDPITSIKQSAALAIGRLAKKDIDLASSVIEEKGKILGQLLDSLESNNRFNKKAACYVISSVAKHSLFLAEKVVEGGAIEFLVGCLEDYDPTVKESAAFALGNIAKHSPQLALKLGKKAIECLILCLQEPEINIKRIAINTLSNIARHSLELTNAVSSGDNLNIIIYYLVLKDTALKRQILLCLANMAHHSSEVAFHIIGGLQSTQIEECIKNKDKTVQENALVLLNEIAKKKFEYATTISSKVKFKIFIDYLNYNTGESRLFGIPILSTLASYKEMAESIIKEGGLVPLVDSLEKENNDKINSLACLAIGNLAGHSADLTNSIAAYSSLPFKLLATCIHVNFSHELKENARFALENIIENCTELKLLNPLLDKPEFSGIDEDTYEKILVKIIRRQKEILNDNKKERKEFIKDKTLKKIIELKKYYKSIKDELLQFNEFYSQEIINYFSEDYEQQIKEKYLSSNL